MISELKEYWVKIRKKEYQAVDFFYIKKSDKEFDDFFLIREDEDINEAIKIRYQSQIRKSNCVIEIIQIDEVKRRYYQQELVFGDKEYFDEHERRVII